MGSTMTEERARRKLSGILSVDAVAYSRLMEEDEVLTIHTLADSKELIAKLIQQHRGRVVDAPGDNLLAEFGSVVDATECAVKIQQELKVKYAELPDDRKMQFRIGVNLGDVVEEADHIYGDGVNIAARIEGLADPGGVCISRTAYDHVKNKLKIGYEYLGEHSVKNISEPVRVYRVLMEPEAAGKVIGEKRFLGRISRNAAITVIIILLILAGSVIGWNIYLHQSNKIESASLDNMVYPLPKKPSIAVLPFTNLTGDHDQEYFIDGLTEELITALSKVPKLFVIARNSSFTYKGKPVVVQRVSEELGVRYVLEGSVRKTGDQVRITAQLIDAIKGRHLWSERYDRNMNDIFAVQDEITLRIITALQVKLTEGEQERILSKTAKNLQTYLKCLEGEGYLRQLDREGNTLAKEVAKEVIRLDPDDARGWTILARTHMFDVWFGLSKSPEESLENALQFAQKARDMEPLQAFPNVVMAHTYLTNKRYDEAVAAAEKALELEPGSADPYATFGHVLIYSGRYEEAVNMLEKAMRLNPYPPIWYFVNLGDAYDEVGRKEEAIQTYKKGLEEAPSNFSLLLSLTCTYVTTGRLEKARSTAKAVLKAHPTFTIEQLIKMDPSKDNSRVIRTAEALRKAGLK